MSSVRAVYLTVLHRLMISGSDRHASDWRGRVRVPGADGLDLDQAYKATAWLNGVGDNGCSSAEAVEEALYRRRQPLFGTVSIAFIDTTTWWFGGASGENLGHYGHSKDYRGHLKQLVLGIVLDDTDRPIASFLMRRNTANVTRRRDLCLPLLRNNYARDLGRLLDQKLFNCIDYVLLDMYRDVSLSQAEYERGTDPLLVASWFDKLFFNPHSPDESAILSAVAPI
jgi:hypothetical protein